MKINKNGFTLVELLIVIALIAILSVAVLATINPIEQSNKARDAKFKNDAAEVLSAYERYYTSSASYPWMVLGLLNPDPAASIDDSVVFRSSTPHFGVVPNGGTSGALIASSELKSSFMSKESFLNDGANVLPEDAMFTYHNGTTNDNYVCYHPKASVNRQMTTKLKCLVNYDAALGTGSMVDYSATSAECNTIPDPWSSDIVDGDNPANLLCVPEGSII